MLISKQSMKKKVGPFYLALVFVFLIHPTLYAASTDLELANIPPIKVSLQYETHGPVSSWAEKIDTIFPVGSESFDIQLNLKDFGTLTLSSLNYFLTSLSEREDIVSKICNITMKNGTSFRFNKMKDGLISIASKDPGIRLEYMHSKTQTAASPAKVLTRVARERGYKLSTLSPGHLIVEPAEESDGASTVSDLIAELPRNAKEFEKGETSRSLKAAYDAISGHDLGPLFALGISDKNQIVEIYGDDLDRYKAPEGIEPVYIRSSGMSGYNVENLCLLCERYKTIKAIRFIDSAMRVEDIEPMLPLIGRHLLMVDIRGAFGAYDARKISSEIRDFLESKGQWSLMKYFFFGELLFPLPPFECFDDSRLIHYFKNSAPNQNAMKIINDYVEFMEEDDYT